MTKRERMSSVDTAWLRMDRPYNLMMIVGVLMFEGPLDFDRLRQVISMRLCGFRRFRQCAIVETTGAYWADDPEFDIDNHLKRTRLPSPGGKVALEKLAADLVTTPLDPSRPLWQFLVVENYDGGWAIVARIHHSIADGIALVGVLLSMTDETPEGGPAAEPAETPVEEDQAAAPDPLRDMIAPVAKAVSATLGYSGAAWNRYVDLLANPGKAADYARVGTAIASEVAELLIMANDSPTRFKGKPGHAKAVAWTAPMPLGEIKAVCGALGCSVNDILMSCVAGALRDYLIERGDPADGVEVRGLVPVNLRPPGEEGSLGNRFGLVALELPVGTEHPIARLYEVKRRMENLKGRYQAPVTLALFAVVGVMPKVVQEQILDMLATKASAVVTNVPGPQKPLYMAGAKLKEQMFWVPQSGDIAMGISILSYNGGVQFGVVTDRKMVPDPERIVERFRPEFEKVLYRLLLQPWEQARGIAEIEQDFTADREIAAAPATGKPAKPRARKPAAGAAGKSAPPSAATRAAATRKRPRPRKPPRQPA